MSDERGPHQKPDIVVAWEETCDAYFAGPPKVCFSCDYYEGADGNCTHFNLRPPQDFVGKVGKCPEWIESMPF